MDHLDDDALVQMVQAGDPDAWDTLYLRYHKRLVGLFRAKGFHSPEDAAQDAWLRLMKALPSYGFRGRFSTWFFVVAKNAAYHAMRKQPQLQIVYDDNPAAPVNPDDEVPAEQTAMSRVFARQLIEQLADDIGRQVLHLRLWENCAFSEIGATLGIQEGTARHYYARAMYELQGILRGIAPPASHTHRPPGLSPHLRAECRSHHERGTFTPAQLAQMYGVPHTTMLRYLYNVSEFTCDRCGVVGVRAGIPNGTVCKPCIDYLRGIGQWWCTYGKHEIPATHRHRSGYCTTCQRSYQVAWHRKRAPEARLRHITCQACGATNVRPVQNASQICGPCHEQMTAQGLRWCPYGKHAVAPETPGRRGICNSCTRVKRAAMKAKQEQRHATH